MGRASGTDARQRRGAHVPGVGQFNEAVVLEIIRHADQGIERSAIAALSGLSAQTISNVTRRLIGRGVVTEQIGPATGPGKPPAVLALRDRSRFSIGVHLDPVMVSVTVLDLRGATVEVVRQPPPGRSPDAVLASIVEQIEHAVRRAGIDRAHVLGVGVATPGPIDDAAGTIDPPLLAGWHRVPIRDRLMAATGFPVLIERDVDAAAVGELWRDPAAADLLFVYVGTGLNSAIALDRRLVRGSRRRAGRLAHLSSGRGSPECSCGRTGCVGRQLAPDELVRRARALGASVESLDALIDTAADGGPAARALAEAGAGLGEAVVTLAAFLDLPRVVVGGPFWDRIERFAAGPLSRVVDAAERDGRCGPLAVAWASTTDVAAVGAGTLVLDTAFSPRADHLVISSGNR